MNEEVNYHEELDTIIELIVAIIFMTFGVFAIAYTVAVFSAKIEVTYKPDKLSSKVSREITDPMYFTGYEAYMMAWHMDNLSDEPLMYISTTSTSHNPAYGNDEAGNYCDAYQSHVILSVNDLATDEPRPSFINWRNKRITGAMLPSGSPSVQSMVNGVAYNKGIDPNLLWSGSDVMFHLEHTFDNMESSGMDGKESIWQLTPVNVTP